jgi:DNA-binding CsgD family transcriptional regulator
MFPYKDYSKEKRNELAKTYLDEAMSIAKRENYKSIEVLCYTTYAELCLDKSCVKNYLEKAYHLTKLYNLKKGNYVDLYIIKTLKSIYQEEKNYELAYKLSEEELNLTNISAQNLNKNRKKLIEVYDDLEQKKQQISLLTTTNKTNTIQKFLFLGMLIFALVGLIFMFYTFRYKQKLSKQNTNILQAEIKESELILKLEKEEKNRLKVEQDLISLRQEHIQKQALAVSIQLNHKNSFIRELKDQLKNTDVNIDKILRNERVTENDFAEIKDVLQEVHPNFFKKLNSLAKTKLSNLDQKYAAYIYINMDNQKISNILNVDPHTVRVTKYRLKQKLGLDKSEDLQTFLQNLV